MKNKELEYFIHIQHITPDLCHCIHDEFTGCLIKNLDSKMFNDMYQEINFGLESTIDMILTDINFI
jgi:hypothetical protein